MATRLCDEQRADLTVLYRTYSPELMGRLRTFVPGDAEDLLSLVWLKAAQALGQTKARGRFFARPWLHRIAGNVIIDYWRRQAVRRGTCSLDSSDLGGTIQDGSEGGDEDAPGYGELIASLLPGPEETVVALERQRSHRAAIEMAFSGLNSRRFLAVYLRDVEGWSVSRISSYLGCSEAAVKSHLFRARGQLRTALATCQSHDG